MMRGQMIDVAVVRGFRRSRAAIWTGEEVGHIICCLDFCGLVIKI